MRLAEKRVLVVGASAGLGRAAGLAIAAEGGHVAFAARRGDRLEEAVAEASGKSIAVRCDVTDEAACQAAVSTAAATFGGLDAIVYTPGIAYFSAIEDIPSTDWRHIFDTNVVGASAVARAAFPHLAETRGKAVFFSSIVIDDSPPRPGAAPYVVSKRALEALIEAWQGEHHEIGFTTIAMGDSLSEFGVGHNVETMLAIVERWAKEGYMYGRMMEASSVAEQVVNALASPETVRRIALTPNFAAEDRRDAVELAVAELEHAERSRSGQ